MEEMVADYQVSCKRNTSTTDLIFATEYILDKCCEKDTDVHVVLTDFERAFNSVNRNQMYKVLAESDIPKKLVTVIRIALTDRRQKIIYEDINWKNSSYKGWNNDMHFVQSF